MFLLLMSGIQIPTVLETNEKCKIYFLLTKSLCFLVENKIKNNAKKTHDKQLINNYITL